MLLSLSACDSKHIFRDLDLGMSMDEVKNAEQDSQYIGENGDAIIYFVNSIYGFEREDMMAIYMFESGALTGLALLIDADAPDEMSKTYQTLRKSMIKMFGKTYSEASTYLIWSVQDRQVTLIQWSDELLMISITPND